MIKMYLEGLDVVRRRLDAGMKSIKPAGRAAMETEGEEALRVSNMFVPVKTGELKASGMVVKQETRRSYDVGVVYTAPYAGAVHERTYVKHQSGRAKFLETARNLNEPELGDRVAAAVWDAVARAFR